SNGNASDYHYFNGQASPNHTHGTWRCSVCLRENDNGTEPNGVHAAPPFAICWPQHEIASLIGTRINTSSRARHHCSPFCTQSFSAAVFGSSDQLSELNGPKVLCRV